MSGLMIKPLSVVGLTAEPALDGDIIRVKMIGSADLETRGDLENFIGRLHDEALRLKVARVEIDLMRMEFMNSSCFKTFLTWIHRVQEGGAGARYFISFLSNDRMHWQKRSMQAMRCFAVDLISVESRAE